MNDLVDMLREAFYAGANNATEYENGSRGNCPDFKKWHKENQKEIEELHKLLMIRDGYKQFRRNDEVL